MKTILFLLFLCSPFTQDPLSYLIGEWKLEKLETKNGTIKPSRKEYNLTISNKGISFNLDINDCFTDSFSIDNEEIILYRISCSQVCCDGRFDTIANYINYSGSYVVKDSLLIISNDKGKLYLKKSSVY